MSAAMTNKRSKTTETDEPDAAPGVLDMEAGERKMLKAAIVTAGATNVFDAIDPTVLPLARKYHPERLTDLLDSIGGLTYVGMRDDHHRPVYIVTADTAADYQRHWDKQPKIIVATTGSDYEFTVTEQQPPPGPNLHPTYELTAFDPLGGEVVDGFGHGKIVLTKTMTPDALIRFGAQLQHIGAQALLTHHTDSHRTLQ